MTKFHINKHGMPAPCKAEKGSCPYGGEESHFNNLEEAQEFIDIRNEERYGLLSSVDGRRKMDKHDRVREMADILGYERTVEELSKSITTQELKEMTSSIIRDYDLDDYIDEDYETYEQFDQVSRFLGHELILTEMTNYLSGDEIHDSLDYIERQWDLNFEKENEIDLEEKFNNLVSDTNEVVKRLNEDVEKWLDDTEDLV